MLASYLLEFVTFHWFYCILSSMEIRYFGKIGRAWNLASSKFQKRCKTCGILISPSFWRSRINGFQSFSLVLIAFHERLQFGIFRSNSKRILSRLQKTFKNILNIDNFAMLKVIARHFCFTFVANINDFDFAELLMIIFVGKALDVKQNARGHM